MRVFGRGRIALGVLAALAWASAARAQECAPAPAIDPRIQFDLQQPASKAGREAAMKAEKVWAAPRLKYGVCRRAEIDAMGTRVNALGAQVNAIVDEVAPLDRKLRAARAERDKAFEAFAKKRKVKPSDLPIAARTPVTPLAPPCPAAPVVTTLKAFPRGDKANARDMRRADEALRGWSDPLEAYLVCRKTERDALAASYKAAKDRYDSAQTDFAVYRAAFNAVVARFETDIGVYTAAIDKTGR